MRRSTLALGVASCLLSAGVVAAALTSIDEPATVSERAVRVRRTGPSIGGCDVFPADNAWNRRVDTAPLRADSDAIIATIQSIGGTRLHPDFGENPRYGIPYLVVGPDQPTLPIDYRAYGDESDPGPFPIPLDAPVEGGSGRRVTGM